MTKQDISNEVLQAGLENLHRETTAEWLAENVLGYTRNDEKQMWECDKAMIDNLVGIWYTAIERLVYSPKGFFAVWDKLHPSYTIQFIGDMCVVDGHKGYGKDRYEAFYNAVMEVYKDE